MKGRTKKMFVDAILSLSKQKPLENITVTDLINFCHVNRYTFYYHFKDKYDLILYVAMSTVREIFSSIEDDGKTINKESLRLWFSHIKENRKFYKSAFSDQSSYALGSAWYEFNLGLYRTMARKALKIEQLDKDADVAIRFALGGDLRLLLDWLNNDCQEDVEEMVYYSDLYFSLLYDRFVGNVSVSKYLGSYAEEKQKAPK